ncbi:hypothetical protein RJ639_003074 [Escallonia herrerae]|uniref:Uncharacterized protein n=1 Tax=Escallonia herrerae TaxID=1293975 RepID=A0AA88W117_9ASTE|nr:hypothetical protein RJ639_003074 [Escallonia herrerae]
MDNQGGGGACMMMGYGDSHTTNIGTASSNGQLLCPTMLMMMPPPLPPISSSHSHPISDQHNSNHNHRNNNTLFLPLPLPPPPTTNTTTNTTGCYFMMDSQNNHHHHNSGVNGSGSSSSSFSPSSVVKAKIMSHPLYHRLLSAYANCQKIGAPPEVVARLEEACASLTAGARTTSSGAGEDPALDQFMEAYLEMLTKYELELSKPFKEAMLFLSRIESQFKSLTLTGPYLSSDSHMSTAVCGEALDRNGSSEEEADVNNNLIDPQAEDRELKGQLLRKYSGYLGSLKQEFMKKRKKGKLPKEARQQLLDWWSRHYKWPYPSESQKLALAETTGLDQKQINNWFINQRKRHWKPSEDMQFVVMDAAHPHYYVDNVLGNSFPMDISPALL